MKKHTIMNRLLTYSKFKPLFNLSVLFLTLCLFEVQANSFTENQRFDLDFKNIALKKVLKRIEKNTEYSFFYKKGEIDLNQKISLSIKKENISDVLGLLFDDSNIEYEIVNRHVLLKSENIEYSVPSEMKVGAQRDFQFPLSEVLTRNHEETQVQFTVSGTVRDTDGNALSGVAIIVSGTDQATVTDFFGEYSIEVEDQNATLVFSYLGFETMEVQISDRSEIDITMREDPTTLGETVITAFGIERERKSLGYAVQEVDGSVLAQSNDGNILNSIKGLVAGAQISTSNAGLAGSSSTVLRGFTSLSGDNDALYVVDGIPFTNFAPNQPNSGFAPRGVSDNILSVDRGSGISDLDPNTIESVTVLKGPSAATLYGARGANGVILITTKKGSRSEDLEISYSGTVRATVLGFRPELQNEYGQGSRNKIGHFANQDQVDLGTTAEAYQDEGGSWGPRFDNRPYIVVWRRERFERTYQANPNLVTDFYQTGITTTHSLTLNGRSANGYISAALLAENLEDIVPTSKQDKYGLNIRINRNLTDKLSFDTRLSYTTKSTYLRGITGHRGAGFYLNIAPRDIYTQDIKDYRYGFSGRDDWDDFRLDNHPTTWLDSRGSSAGNPYWEVYENPNEDQQERITGFAKFDYNFTSKLNAFVRLGFDNLTNDYRYVREKYSRYGGGSYDGFLQEGSNLRKEINADFLISYDYSFGENMEVSLSAGGNHLYRRSDSRNAYGYQLVLIDQTHFGNTVVRLADSNFNAETGINSLYGFGSIAYKDLLFLDASIRNDWFSTLSDENNSLLYAGVNLAFSLTDAFGIASDFLNFAKVRGSYAEAGNGTGQSIYTFANFGVDALGRPLGTISNALGNVDLRPERNKSIEIGTDIRLFNSRLNIDFTWYSAKIEDQIVSFPLAQSSGANTRSSNVGEIQNKGVEIVLNTSPVRSNHFSWNARLNYADNNSTLVEISENVDQFYHWGFRTKSGGGVISKVGESYAALYGTTVKRDGQGRVIVDANGIPLAGEVKKIGETQVDFTAGFQNTVVYKNFQLSVLIDGSFGGAAVSQTFLDMNRSGTSVQSLDGREAYIASIQNGTTLDGINSGSTGGGLEYHVGNSVFEDGTPNSGANAVYAHPGQYWNQLRSRRLTELYTLDATFVKLREINLSYRLPRKIVDQLPFENVRFTLTGRNVAEIYNGNDYFDADAYRVNTNQNTLGVEHGSSPSRSFLFNVTLQF